MSFSYTVGRRFRSLFGKWARSQDSKFPRALFLLGKESSAILERLKKEGEGIDPKRMNLAKTYAQDVLGNARYAPWLYIYATVRGEFKEGWIPEDYYVAAVVPAIKGKYDELSKLRALNRCLFQSASIPDVLYSVNGSFITVDGSRVAENELKDVLFARRNKTIFKRDDSGRGLKITVLTRDGFRAESIRDLGEGVFQDFVEQHDVFREFGSDAVATLRVTTVIDPQGSVSARGCYLRLGRKGEHFVQSRSNIRIPVDLATGELFEKGYWGKWIAVGSHPDSQVRFQSTRVPAFRECVSTVVAFHRSVPFARCVGWDVTVDVEENVRVLEWNGGLNAIGISEAMQGPCFADMGWERLWRESNRTANGQVTRR